MQNVILLAFLFPFLFFSQGRKYSNEFLSLGVDARAFGMGNAVVANQSDVNSVYWNPAGLADVTDDMQFAAMHAEYFSSIANYDYLAAAIPLRNQGTLGVSVFRFGVDNILNTTDLIDSQGNINYDNITQFSAADYAAVISYGGRFLSNSDLALGASAKIIYRNVGKFARAYGFGLDFGLRYQTEDDFYFGLMARDITTTFNVWKINQDKLKQLEVEGVILNSPPEENLELTLPKLSGGVGKKFYINDNFSAMTEFNLEFNFNQQSSVISTKALSLSPALGVEFAYQNLVYLRGGINNFQYEKDFDNNQKMTFQPNMGIGVKFNGISIDYSLTDIGDKSVALYSNIFSVKIDLDGFR